jgi:cell division protein FtsN
MSNLSKILLLCVLIVSVGLSSCKEEAKTAKKKTTTEKVAKKKEVKKPAAKPVAKKKLEPVVEKVPNKYFLIVASFEKQSNADKLQNKLKTEGYGSEVHNATNGFYRVSYKGFSDRKLAFQELKNVRSTEEHKDTWLYIKR